MKFQLRDCTVPETKDNEMFTNKYFFVKPFYKGNCGPLKRAIVTDETPVTSEPLTENANVSIVMNISHPINLLIFELLVLLCTNLMYVRKVTFFLIYL